MKNVSRRDFLKGAFKVTYILPFVPVLQACSSPQPAPTVQPGTSPTDALNIARNYFEFAKVFVESPVLTSIQSLPTGNEMYDWLRTAAKIDTTQYLQNRDLNSKIQVDPQSFTDFGFVAAYFNADTFSQFFLNFVPWGIDLANENVPQGVKRRYIDAGDIHNATRLDDYLDGRASSGVVTDAYVSLPWIREAVATFKADIDVIGQISKKLPTDIKQGSIDLPSGLFGALHTYAVMKNIDDMYILEKPLVEIDLTIDNIVAGIENVWNEQVSTGRNLRDEYSEYVRLADIFSNYLITAGLIEKTALITGIGLSDEVRNMIDPLLVSHNALSQKMVQLFGDDWEKICYGQDLVNVFGLAAGSGIYSDRMQTLSIGFLADYTWAKNGEALSGSFTEILKGERLNKMQGSYGQLNEKYNERKPVFKDFLGEYQKVMGVENYPMTPEQVADLSRNGTYGEYLIAAKQLDYLLSTNLKIVKGSELMRAHLRTFIGEIVEKAYVQVGDALIISPSDSELNEMLSYLKGIKDQIESDPDYLRSTSPEATAIQKLSFPTSVLEQ